MAHHQDRNRSTERDPAGYCSECANKSNQLERHCHFLKLGDGLAGHLHRHYVDYANSPEAAQHGQQVVSSIVAWVKSIQDSYGDIVDEHGAPLSVCDAWLAMHRAHNTEMRA